MQESITGETKDVLLLDVTNDAYGIGLEDDRFEIIVEKNTTIPVTKSRDFTTTRANQTEIQVPVYQGRIHEASKNTLLCSLRLTGIPSAPAGVPKIKVTFEIGPTMLLRVSAKDAATGKEQAIVANSPHALEPEQLHTKAARLRRLLASGTR